MNEEDFGICVFDFAIYGGNSNDFSVVDRLSVVASGRVGPLLPSVNIRKM